MAKLSKEDVLKLAKLSRLELSDEEIESYREELSSILGYVEKLQGAELEGVEPTLQVTGLKDVMRGDEINDYGTSNEELLKNAPDTEDGYIKVQRVLQ